MFNKIKAVAEYTIMAYTAVFALKGFVELGHDIIDHYKYRPSKK